MTDTAAKTPDTLTFEAEVQSLLDLVIHSLYTNREIFLRELISNASDALDKLRFTALTDAELLPEGDELCVSIERDEEAGTLTIIDNGIGMNREDLMANLGTLASSGTRRFLEELREADAKTRPELIGQFGVGFYSSFMVADKVVVTTRKAGEQEGWIWQSAGGGEYTVEEAAENTQRGTRITLHMQPGEDEQSFLTEWKVREIVRRYSDFIEYPVTMDVTRNEPELDDEGKPVEDGETKEVTSTETLNSMKPLWNRPKAEISAEEYAEFYKHLTHDWNEPAEVIHFRAEGTLEYTALLFIPKERPFDMFDSTQPKSRLSLHVRKVMVMNDCEELLPPWLRFVRGVVDSADLPLNVSRETLQDNPLLKKIQTRLVKKVLEVLDKRRTEQADGYAETWKAYGTILKEGIYMGDDGDNRISKLCLFRSSSHDPGAICGTHGR
jgi:molecular chaperone HtpG